ncbi:MAG: RNA-binding S4 domain-containing protein [Thermoanaerobaculia bacterium]|nr:RNA-binding S4 domain-containing protein [Thermoanaerobaculia bacterium]
MSGQENQTEQNRIDLWLKHVCLFKTRSEAGKAVRGGHVKVNGSRVKPAASVAPDDRIEITRSRGSQTVEVVSIPERQVSRKEARNHYNDLTPEPESREAWEAGPKRVTRGKLSKKERRELRRLKGR